MYRILVLYFFSALIAQHSFAAITYHSYFYDGLILAKGETDTIRGQISLQPDSYYDTVSGKKAFQQYSGYAYAGYAVVYQVDSVTHTTQQLFFKMDEILFVRLFYKVRYIYHPRLPEVFSFNYSFWRPHQGTIQINKAEFNSDDTIKEFCTDYKSFVYNNHTILLRMLNAGKVSVFDTFLNPEKNITDSYALEFFLTPIYSSVFNRDRIFVFKNGILEEIPGHADFSFNFQRTRFILKFINKRYKIHLKFSVFDSNRQMFAYISEHG